MKPWVLHAFISMVFAGATSVVAKKGLDGISSDLGLVIRTLYVFVFVLLFAAVVVPIRALEGIRRDNLLWLGLSGVTTAASWIFYYKALKDGSVSTVALIDKGSVVVAVVLAALLLKEAVTLRTLAGGVLMVAGLLVLAKR